MNILTKEMRRSLKELDLGLKGELTITNDMEDLGNSLFFDQVRTSLSSFITLLWQWCWQNSIQFSIYSYFPGSSKLDQKSLCFPQWFVQLVRGSDPQNQRIGILDFRFQSSFLCLASRLLQSPILFNSHYAKHRPKE